MRFLLLVVGLLLVGAGTAEARMHAPYRGHRIIPAAGAPLDGFTTPTGAYGFRKLRSAYAGPAIRIRRTIDNAELDINFLGFTSFTGAPWDEAAAVAHCAATSCFVVTWYDQSGNARHITQATAANQPQLIFNCNGNLPCMRTAVATQLLATAATYTPASAVASVSAVVNRRVSAGGCQWVRNGSGSFSRLVALSATANTAQLAGSSGNIVATAADAAWYAGAAVIAGAASSLNVNGVTNTGTVIGSTLAGNIGITGGSGTTCDFAEGIYWDSYQLTPAEGAVLIANQRAWGGF